MSEEFRPATVVEGDKEIEVHHELDGPLQGFGRRLWDLVMSQHSASLNLFDQEDGDIYSVLYSDRYLFTPLSVALLAEVVGGLRESVGRARWAIGAFEVRTMGCRSMSENWARNTVWADWHDTNIRDEIIKSTFEYIGIESSISAANSAMTAHGRLLEVGFSSGKKLTLRFDQGVSYWREAHSNSRKTCYFDIGAEASDNQGSRLADLALDLEGSRMPTQLFVKVR